MADEPEVVAESPVAEEAPKVVDKVKLAGEVNRKYDDWRQPRKQHELTWFVNAAYRHGKHTTEALNTRTNQIRDIARLDRRKKNIANKLWAKGRARFAKFVKSRPKPIVVPFGNERQDRLDARATERALDYNFERIDQEEKYTDVILWAADTGKAYWAIHWDPDKMVTIQQNNQLTGKSDRVDAPEGDIDVEVFSAFEMLVPDLRRSRLKDQPECMRVRVQHVKEVKAQFPDEADNIKADTHLGSPFEFERQIAHLSGMEAGALASVASELKGPTEGVLVKEHYTKPNSEFKKGRMVVVVNSIAVKIQEELPHGFFDMENPYPFTEFADMPQVGQFYITTFIQHLIPLQRGYNMVRDKMEANLKANANPKWMVPRQARVPKGAFTNETGELVEYNYIPGMPEPRSVTPGPVVADAWRFITLIREEFDDISQIFPSVEGQTGGAKSGFQTNLLQEASDSIHAPDARGFELAIRDASYKFRRLMKEGYSVPRLISFSGRSSIPEVFEFSSKNIDEHAAIKIQIGSGLSTFKAARVQQLLEFHEKGLLGNPDDPEVKRRVLSLVDLGGVEEFREKAARDEDMARMENIDILANKEIPIPQFYEDHMVHYSVHTDELKSPANRTLDEPTRRKLVGHVLLHMKWINPEGAFNLAKELKFDVLIESGLIPTPPPVEEGEETPTPTPQPAPQPSQ